MSDTKLFFLCLSCGGVHELNGVSVRYPPAEYPHKDTCSVCGKHGLGYTYLRRSDYNRLPKRGDRKRG